MIWQQEYNPIQSILFSTLLAAIPAASLLLGLAVLRLRAHIATILALGLALAISVIILHMPATAAIAASLYGGATGLLPIGWIILNIIFLQKLSEHDGGFEALKCSLSRITPDRRIQLLLIAFCFGAFLEGAAGFGAPVAVTAGILIGLGFSPFAASCMSLIANTAPVPFAALGTPVITMANLHGYDVMALSAMVGRQVPLFSLIVPFWMIWAFAGRKGMWEIWPAILVTGLSFAIPQFFVANFIGPELVDIIASLCSMSTLVIFLKYWQPAQLCIASQLGVGDKSAEDTQINQAPLNNQTFTRRQTFKAWLPWILLTATVFILGLPSSKLALNSIYSKSWEVPYLHHVVQKVPPAIAEATNEAAIFQFNILSSTGTLILFSAILCIFALKIKLGEAVKLYIHTLYQLRFSLTTIFLMFALGMLTRYSGLDTTLGLAFASTGVMYPFFGTLMGWIGVAMTGSDTASNVLFGGMHKIASEQLNLSSNLMGAANSSGGVMGKMIDAQSIVVASTATRWFNHEGEILRYVFFHSIALASLVGIWVTLQAYVYPFTLTVIH
jgi:lactate permease